VAFSEVETAGDIDVGIAWPPQSNSTPVMHCLRRHKVAPQPCNA
jgi:hypothetical protein